MKQCLPRLVWLLFCCQIGGCALRGSYIGSDTGGGGAAGGVFAPWLGAQLPANPDFGTPLVQTGGVRGATAAGAGDRWIPIPVSQNSISLAGLPGR